MASMQAGRPITVVAADPIQMQRAILNPLSMGSRGRYVLVLGVQVWPAVCRLHSADPQLLRFTVLAEHVLQHLIWAWQCRHLHVRHTEEQY